MRYIKEAFDILIESPVTNDNIAYDNIFDSMDDFSNDPQGKEFAESITYATRNRLKLGDNFWIQVCKPNHHSKMKINADDFQLVYGFYCPEIGRWLKIGQAADTRVNDHYKFCPDLKSSTLSNSLILAKAPLIQKNVMDDGVDIVAHRKLIGATKLTPAQAENILKTKTKFIGDWVEEHTTRYVAIIAKDEAGKSYGVAHAVEGFLINELDPMFENTAAHSEYIKTSNIQRDDNGRISNAFFPTLKTRAKKYNATAIVDKAIKSRDKDTVESVNCILEILDYLQTTEFKDLFTNNNYLDQHYTFSKKVSLPSKDTLEYFIRYTKNEIHVGINFEKYSGQFSPEEIKTQYEDMKKLIPEIKISKKALSGKAWKQIRLYIGIPKTNEDEVTDDELASVEETVRRLKELPIK